MTILTLKSPAKVNLTLDVLEREPSGYHRIQTIFHEVEKLYDTLIFEEVSGSRVWLEPHGLKVPNDETNTIIKAVRLLQNEYKLQGKGMRIILEKRIPPESGLGGAASNAAITLRALNSLWGLNLTTAQLLTHAAAIGMDVPFFILGGCALGTHYGEQLEHLPTLDVFGYAIEIILTGIAVSTRDAYAALKPPTNAPTLGTRTRDTGRLVKILKKKGPPTPLELEEIPRLLHNDFELLHKFSSPPRSGHLPLVKLPLQILSLTSPKVHLSGSGGARFRLVRLT